MHFFEKLREEGLLSDHSLQQLSEAAADNRISLHAEIRALLYGGILLFAAGLGIFVYSHLEQFGYFVLIGAMLLIIAGTYSFCVFTAKPFHTGEVESPNTWFDYLLLLGAITIVTLCAYLQQQFGFFGKHWSPASFVPMVLLFLTAYYFDHRGVLCLAVTNLAAWVGITMNRSTWYGFSLMKDGAMIQAAALLGVFLLLLSRVVKQRHFKSHFEETYHQFGTHFLLIACVAGIIQEERAWAIWLLILLAAGYYLLRKGFREKSSYYLVVACLYAYTGISYIVSDKLFRHLRGEDAIYANLFYYLCSGIGLAFLIYQLTQKLKTT